MSIYKVHSRHDTHVAVQAKLPDGTDVVGHVPTAVIELIGEDGYSVTLRKRLVPAEAKAAVDAVFNEGATVQMGDFTLVEAAPAKEAK